MKALLTVVLLIIRSSCFCQTYLQNDFVKVPVPLLRSKEWYNYNLSSRVPFAVTIVNGKLHIEKATDGTIKEFQINNAKLLAIEGGEWGGGLYLRPDNKDKKSYHINGKTDTLKDRTSVYKMFIPQVENVELLKGKSVTLYSGNTSNVFAYKDSLYFTTGYPQVGHPFGFLYSLQYQNNIIKTNKIVDVGTASNAVGVYKDLILIATPQSFCIIKNWKKELILDNLFWSGFNPNSIAVLDYNNVFIGMYGFYAKIDLENKNMELYRYNK